MSIKNNLQNKLFSFFLTILSLSAFSQTQPTPSTLNKLAEPLHAKAKHRPSESIYLQSSKGIYESGEDLWFKAYILEAQSLIPSMLSQTLYLQMVKENTRQAVWQEKYEIKSGFSDGHAYLPDTLSEGDYLLEAFTGHSFYDDNSRFKAARKVRVIKSINTQRTTVIASADGVPTVAGTKGIHFDTFPEGGRLVAGLPSRLAFKSVDTTGSPVTVSGTLFENDTPLQEFKSSHAGMGSLHFTPIAGKRYQIRISAPKTDRIFTLPEVHSEGICLQLAMRDSSHLEFAVYRTGGSKGMVYLRGQLRGQTVCIASGILNQRLKIKIPLKEFMQQGIAEFTLFDENLIPLAERLVYVHPNKKLYIKAELSKAQYKLREKATLKIKVSDEYGQPVTAQLGLSVFDKLYQNQKDPKNILTHYYLCEQLKGRIYDPAHYFDEKNKNRHEALDLLLLTQGWRNYIWNEENLNAYKNTKPEVLLDGIAGEVHNTKKQKKAHQVEQFIQIFSPDEKGKTKYSAVAQSDSTGKFMISEADLKGGQGGYLYLKPLGVADLKPRISLDDPFKKVNTLIKDEDVIFYPLPNVSETTKEEPFRLPGVGPRVVKLNEVVIKASGAKVFRDKYLGRLDSLAKVDVTTDYLGVPCNTLNCYVHPEDKSQIPVDGKSYNALLGKNGEILGSDHQGGYFGERSIIYNNPNQNFTEEELLKRNNLSKIKAYYAQREFYQPEYDKEPAGDGLPDVRNTLLWAPALITDKNGEATLTFFCSDINTGFIGKIEGVSSDGLLGMANFEFRVFKTENN